MTGRHDEQTSREAHPISLSLEWGFKESIGINLGCWQVHSSFLGAPSFQAGTVRHGRARTKLAQRLVGILKRLEKTEMPEMPDINERYRVIARKEDSPTAP